MTDETLEPTHQADFILKITEQIRYSAEQECFAEDEIDGGKLSVRLVPPIPSWVYEYSLGRGPNDLHRMVLMARHVGTSLTPMSESRLAVNMLVPKSEGDWTRGPWTILDIGFVEKVEHN